jgi:predicted adenylyl cyclase CyaB
LSLPDGPRANIEIKARLHDPGEAIRIARSLEARDVGSDRQVDTYFKVPRGRLKLRESASSGDQLIIYFRPDQTGPRRADYQVIPAPPGGRTRELLESMFGIEVVVEKVRRLFWIGDTRIHLDDVRELGAFLEFEAVFPFGDTDRESAARAEVERLIDEFGIPPDDLVPHSYRELLLEARS